MTMLEQIVKAKRRDVQQNKQDVPVAMLEKSGFFQTVTYSLESSLNRKDGYGIIAEFKRQSPSRGIINNTAKAEDVCRKYISSGAAGVSILTNREFFGGSNEDLVKARKLLQGPVLRKEFIIDQYQIIESRSLGADVVLLIVDILSAAELKSFSTLATSLNMEVLFEIHDEAGIEKLPPEARMIGVNSRNLGNFSIDMDILKKTIGKLPGDAVKIAESGIDSAETLVNLKNEGFGGFLIGERFMREADPGISCNDFISKLNNLQTCK